MNSSGSLSQALRIAPLDGLRGVAVLAVIGYHTKGVPQAGRVGVDLFFVLSGFLITNIIAKGYGDGWKIFLPHFVTRRFARLFPALLVACGLYLAIWMALPGLDPRPVVSVISALTMTSNYTQAANWGFPTALGHTWTLAVEWQFYLLWPLAFFALRWAGVGTRGLIITLLAGVAAVWISRYYSSGTLWKWRALDARADGLLYGCILALSLNRAKAVSIPRWATVGALVGLTTIAFHPVSIELYASNALAAVVVGGVLTSSCSTLNRALTWRPLTYIGRISYGLYLYHFPIAAACFVSGLSSTNNLLFTVPTSFLFAILSWRYVEQPVLSLGISRASVSVPPVQDDCGLSSSSERDGIAQT